MSASTIIALCISGIIMIACETIIPGGVVGTIGFILAIAGIIGAFSFGVLSGFSVLLAVLVCGLIAVVIMLQILPKTRHGKALCLSEDQKGFSASGEVAPAKIGDIGIALTVLRPSGVAEIDDQRVDVITQGDFIDPNTKIKVIEVYGSRVVVTELFR